MILKFRGLSVDEEKWKYGYLIEDGSEAFIINQVIEADEQYITIGSWDPVNPESVGQSTGFKSDLGDELFEGDIVLWTYWDEFEDEGRAEIIFENGMFKLLDTRTRKEVWDNLFDCVESCNVYLLGNVHQNRELLETNHDRD